VTRLINSVCHWPSVAGALNTGWVWKRVGLVSARRVSAHLDTVCISFPRKLLAGCSVTQLRWPARPWRRSRQAVELTRSSADADKPARRLQWSVKVTKHSTIPCAKFRFLLVFYRNFVPKMHHFWDIRLQKCRDLEILVRGHLRSLKVVSFDRLGMVSY